MVTGCVRKVIKRINIPRRVSGKFTQVEQVPLIW